MKRLVMIAALALAACNPPVDDSAGAFETVALSVITDPECVFRPTGAADDQVVFATYRGNPDHMAMTRFKGETIKLVPRDVPSFDGDNFDITYEVIDYLKWQVRAVSENGVGELRLIRDGEPIEIVAAMTGSCGV